ncbi:hypothetical protein Tco_1192301 [Tanacetum coccineum]
MSASKTSPKLYDWLAITKNDTRLLNKHTKDGKFALKTMLKKHSPSKDTGLPAWQSVCSQFHPRVKIDHPMIRRFEGTRSKAKRSV